MDFLTLAEQRYSVRKFSNTPVENEKLDLILRAGQIAPTAKNFQPQNIFVVQSPAALEKLNRCTPCAYGAPTALIICYDNNLSWKRPHDNKDHGDIDASIITAHMLLEAQALGLGTIWVCYFDPAAIVKEFSLPENMIPSSILPLGYPASDAEPAEFHHQRKSLTETVTFL